MSTGNKSKKKELFPGDAPISEKRKKKFLRGKSVETDHVRDKKLKALINTCEKKYENSVKQAARYDVLMTEQAGFLETKEGEDSWKIKQSEIQKLVDVTSSTKHFELNNLHQFGPYKINYTRNGRYLLLGGRRGHVVGIDWQRKKPMFEFNVNEATHGVQWLHSENMFAVAQREYTCIYDNEGTEIHYLKGLHQIVSMEYLPYHFLLAAGNKKSYLQFFDISVGKQVAGYGTKSGKPLDVMTQNPNNAVVLLGHWNGKVSMWTPNQREAVVQMPCHKCPVLSMAVDNEGRYLATAGGDGKVRIFDIRTYKPLHSYKLRRCASKVAFSQRRLMACSYDNVVEIYKDPCIDLQTDPYLRHESVNNVTDIAFCPYEDVLGAGRQDGFVSLLVPGAGEPNYDGFESNPNRNKKQRREWEVKALLEKIPSDLITLDPNKLAQVDRVTAEQLKQDKIQRLGYTPEEPKFVPRNRKKGKNKAGHIERRKNNEIEKKRRAAVKEKMEEKRKNEEESEKNDANSIENALEKKNKDRKRKMMKEETSEEKRSKNKQAEKSNGDLIENVRKNQQDDSTTINNETEHKQSQSSVEDKKPKKYSALDRFKN